ncbi:MAG: hypothetical protein GY796_05035 [Chloroflexi bacterium]|nr:hypothetical protein [Chloroflexota bacterium]
MRLRYTITPRNEEAQDYDYRVWLQATPLPWGGVRWWFTCPLIIDGKPCKRRVGKLYEPPGARYFGCRHCHDLTYRSSQEQHQYARFYADMALSFQDTYPGITSQEVRRFLDGEQDALFPWFLKRWMDEMQNHDPYAGYLTGENLCKESGLSMQNLAKLEAARLLLPDTKDKRYRPKLAGWAQKLSHLLSEGWETEEIRRWAKGRWRAANPRQWPPDRKEWQS